MDDPTPPRPAVVGSFQPVPAAEPAAKAAVQAALAKLAEDAATRGLDLAAPEVRLVERQIVAGTIFRATLRVGAQGHRRLLRPWLLQDLQGHARLVRLDLAAPGEEAIAAEPPTEYRAPGGWFNQDAATPAAREAVDAAATALAAPGWFAAPVAVKAVTTWRSQVVAGRNDYVAFDATIAGKPYGVAAHVFHGLRDDVSVDWATLTFPAPR